LTPSCIWPPLTTTRYRRLDRTSNSECCRLLWLAQLASLLCSLSADHAEIPSLWCLLLCVYSSTIPPLLHVFIASGMCLQSRYLAVAGSLGYCSLAMDISSVLLSRLSPVMSLCYWFSWVISELSLLTGAFQFLLHFYRNSVISEIGVIIRSLHHLKGWTCGVCFMKHISAIISPLTYLCLVHASLQS
jgi:hypothetical protein